jgi:ribosomal protein S3AE
VSITAPEGTPAYYRQLAAFVRGRTYRDERGSLDYKAIDRYRLRLTTLALSTVKYEKSLKRARKAAKDVLDEIALEDEALIAKMVADDCAKADAWEGMAAELEAKLAQVIPLNTAAMRQMRHVAESVAAAEAKRELAAATCSDDNLESSLRASLGATEGT